MEHVLHSSNLLASNDSFIASNHTFLGLHVGEAQGSTKAGLWVQSVGELPTRATGSTMGLVRVMKRNPYHDTGSVMVHRFNSDCGRVGPTGHMQKAIGFPPNPADGQTTETSQQQQPPGTQAHLGVTKRLSCAAAVATVVRLTKAHSNILVRFAVIIIQTSA